MSEGGAWGPGRAFRGSGSQVSAGGEDGRGPRWARGQAALCPQDAFQEEYCRTGTFPETPMVPPRRPWTLVNWLFWASLLLYPFVRFLVNMVSSGSSLTLAGFVLVFFVGESGAVAGEGIAGLGPCDDHARPWGETDLGSGSQAWATSRCRQGALCPGGWGLGPRIGRAAAEAPPGASSAPPPLQRLRSVSSHFVLVPR